MPSAFPSTRPVHPCVLNVFDGNHGGEYSTFASLFEGRQNLVTAQGSSLSIYDINQQQAKLSLIKRFSDLAGNICYLETLSSSNGRDCLLVGFCGHARLSIVQPTSDGLLYATSLLDLTPSLLEACMGSATPLEQDMVVSISFSNKKTSLGVILGGGVAVACLTLTKIDNTWQASEEPYILPLASLMEGTSRRDDDPASNQNQATTPKIAHGFGDILDVCYLQGYLEPTLVLLHSQPNKGGRAWSGRLGRASPERGTQFGLTLTCLSVTVSHERCAALWTQTVSADAFALKSLDGGGLLVMGVNEICQISNAGTLVHNQVLCVNGWARSTCPTGLLPYLQPNPLPPKLSIQLDGSKLGMIDSRHGILILREGHVYLLQLLPEGWSLFPTGHKIGGIGQVANVMALPFGSTTTDVLQDKLSIKFQNNKSFLMGMLFVGSRLGDSSLLGYAIETNVSTLANTKNDEQEQTTSKRAKVEEEETTSDGDDDYEIILQKEEDALYADDDDDAPSSPTIIPPDDDDDGDIQTDESPKKRHRRDTKISILRSLTALDAITAVGPLGPGCQGPISRGSGAAKVMPCGFGSSGGLALVTSPGIDTDESILAETDCLNAQSIFSLPKSKLLLMGMRGDAGGIHVFRMEQDAASAAVRIVELDRNEWASPSSSTVDDPQFLFSQSTLIGAAELPTTTKSGKFAIVVQYTNNNLPAFAVVILSQEDDGMVKVIGQHNLESTSGDASSILLQVSPFQQLSGSVCFGCVWSSGCATICTITDDRGGESFSIQTISGTATDAAVGGDNNDDDAILKAFYECDRVTAMDIFVASGNTFQRNKKDSENSVSAQVKEEEAAAMKDDSNDEFDEEENELYGTTADDDDNVGKTAAEKFNISAGRNDEAGSAGPTTFVAISRQSSLMEIFELNDLTTVLWTAKGCGLGVTKLVSSPPGEELRIPKFHKVITSELRFFESGPKSDPSQRSLFLAVDTNLGDMQVYKLNEPGSFVRESLRASSRPSKKQSEHHVKLRRKGIVPKVAVDESVTDPSKLRHNRLHRFSGISMKDGLFAATARPMWCVSERNSLMALNHRSKHVAPTGGRARPVSGFSSGLLPSKDGSSTGFVTLHERIGRVGSQRLTVFSGIGNVFSSHGLAGGGGYYAEKIPVGVTVHRVQFIDDNTVSSGSNPLYALLISRELEVDQSNLNADGLTDEQRQEIKDKKEDAKIKRQVEADLGGFDLEQEWVEEIEREDCFEIDMSLGGAPPINQRTYALWIVDASNSWNVVDSYELEEFEHGMTMKIMNLTELAVDPGNNNAETIEENLGTDTLFITIGTGIVDADGEDVTSKGRVMLFEIKRQEQALIDAGAPVAELSLVYEKTVYHGPVSTLSCLQCEGKSRLVIGAGSDVNIEQWGKGRLTQVGFFRGNMQILDIMLFKTFFLLSDAYDSLYFLVWRESDTSLTLLAKDYEPIPVFAAGLLARSAAMTFVCHDDRQNLQFFQYAPGDAAARGGNKLVSRADIHLGAQTVSLENHFCRSSILVSSATPASTMAALKSQDSLFGRHEDDQRIGVHFGTSDGGFGTVLPISERDYWRLAALQSVMANALDSNCALNPRACHHRL